MIYIVASIMFGSYLNPGISSLGCVTHIEVFGRVSFTNVFGAVCGVSYVDLLARSCP